MAKRWRVLPHQLDDVPLDDWLDMRADYRAERARAELAKAKLKPVGEPARTI